MYFKARHILLPIHFLLPTMIHQLKGKDIHVSSWPHYLSSAINWKSSATFGGLVSPLYSR